MKKIDVKIGDKKNRWTVIELLPSYKQPCGVLIRKIKCRCDCGKEKCVYVKHFLSGISTSCGCYLKSLTTTHGMSKHRIFRIYKGIKSRCKKTKNFKTNKSYYDKGISVCKEWDNSFLSFYNWSINNGYKDGLTIDRIDNSKGYYPENCRWTTYYVNVNNRDTTFYVEYKGIKTPFSLLLIDLGLRDKYQKIYERIKKGYDIHQVISDEKTKT